MLSPIDLGQLKGSEPVDPDDTLPDPVGKRGADLSKFATRLSGGNWISDHFPQAPQNGHLRVISHAGEYSISLLLKRGECGYKDDLGHQRITALINST